MRKFTTQTSIDDWRRETDQHIDGLAVQLREEDEAEAFAHRGGVEEQKAASAAYLSWSERFGLTEESLQRMFEYGVSLSHGSLVKDQEEGFLRWGRVPPGWLPMVDSKMVLAKGSGRLKMCFDEHRMRSEGILRWRKDVALLRLGHPAMNKASKRLQRLLWDDSFSRWSIEISDEITEPRFEVAALRIARNKLREPVLAELDVTVHSFDQGSLVSDGARAACGDRFEGDIPSALLNTIRSSWMETSASVQATMDARTDVWLRDLDDHLEKALTTSLADEQKAYKKRMKELKASTDHNEKNIERIRRELEKWENRSLQLTFEGYRLPEAVAKTEEMKAKLVDAEFKRRQVLVDAQVERLQKERDRVLDKIMPMRFTRKGDPQIWPLGVRVLIPPSEVNR